MARIVVSGYIVRYPLAGNVTAHFSYVLGLARLGHEVWFVEDAGWPDSCYTPDSDAMTSDASYGLAYLAELLEVSGLAGHWAFRDSRGNWHGRTAAEVEDLLAAADLYLEVGGVSELPQMRTAAHRAYVDMDPVFTQFGGFANHRLIEFDTLFSYGMNIGKPNCSIPTLGRKWHPLRPPIILDEWARPRSVPETSVKSGRWTTIASWNAYGPREHNGETYGQKDVEFSRFIDLPRMAPVTLELALGGTGVPVDRLRRHGWCLADALAVSRDRECYRRYIWNSRGEFSVAKNAYVKTRSGWFSDRSATYLAAGRPVVVQDTGARDLVPAGCGFLVFSTPNGAIDALAAVEADYQTHAASARQLATTYFDSDTVLNGMLDACGI